MGQNLIRALHRQARTVGIAVVLAAIMHHAFFGLSPAPTLQRFESLLYDVRFRAMLDAPPPSQKIVIVDIDEQSLAAEGQWPWSRARIGDLLAALYDAGAVIVGFDVAFAEPQRNPVDDLLRDGRVAARAGTVLRAERARFDADARFATEIARGETVLGYFLHNELGSRAGVLGEPLMLIPEAERDAWAMAPFRGYAGNLPVLQQAAVGAGSLTALPDLDGVVRRSPLVFRVDDALHPSLSLEVARRFLDAGFSVQTGWLQDTLVLESVLLDSIRIPVDQFGRVVVPYRGHSHSYPYVPAVAVLNGSVPREQIEGAIVLVGTSALGLKDLRSTPLETNYPGVEVHANLIDAMIARAAGEDRFAYRPDYEIGITILLLLLFGMVIVIVQPRLAAGGQLLCTALTIGGAITFNYLAWSWGNLDLPLSPVLITVVLLNVFYIAIGFLAETQRRAQMHSMFGQYVAPAHIDRLLAHPENASFDGESKEMSVLFSDVRSFTTISEKLTAQGLKQLLNRYFTPITRIIFDNQGTIDKYVGDMVMAFWGAPLDDPQHARHAIDSGLEMLRKVDELKEEFGAENLPRIDVGIGINTGNMNVGDMGSSFRRAYTVLGDAVNLGSRLEGATKMYGIRILIGENTAAKVPEYLLRHIDRLQVKGKTEPVKIYEPLCLRSEASPEMLANLELWHRALESYFAQRWDDAERDLQELIAREPQGKLYPIFLDRVRHMRVQPPGEAWDGAYIAKEK